MMFMLINAYRIIAFILLFIPTTEAYGQEVMKNKKVISTDVFIVRTDSAVVVSTKEKADFNIYTFAVDTKVLLSAYAGNHPQYPLHAPKIITNEKDLIGNKTADCVEWKRETEMYSKECLIRVSNEGSFQYVHLYYYDLALSEKQFTDSLIQSLEWTTMKTK